MSAVQCICGADIRWVVLPPDIAAASGVDGLWLHSDSEEWECYPDSDNEQDRVAKATPASLPMVDRPR